MIDEEDSRLEMNVKYPFSRTKPHGLQGGRSPAPASIPSPFVNCALPPSAVQILHKQQVVISPS